MAFALGLVVATAGTATAAKLITGKQIKDHSIAERDLSAGVVAKLGRTAGTGPAGPRGPAGEKGAQGAAGERGAAGDAALSYSASGGHDFVAPDNTASILSIDLPAGTYVLHGQVVVTTTATTTGYAVQCWLGPIIAPIGLAEARLQGATMFQDKATLPVTDVVVLSTTTTLTMRCSLTPEAALAPGTATASATGRLIAQKVSANVAQ